MTIAPYIDALLACELPPGELAAKIKAKLPAAYAAELDEVIQIARPEKLQAVITAYAQGVAKGGVAATTTRTPETAARPEAQKSNTDKSHVRRAALRELGLPAHTRGNLRDLRAAHGCNDATLHATGAPVAPPHSESFLLSPVNEKEGAGGDARARDQDNSVSDFPVTEEQVERLTDEATAIVAEAAKYPHRMIRSVTAEHIKALLKAGVSPNTIRDSIREPAQRAAAPISTFYMFARSSPPGVIIRAHKQVLRARAEKVPQPEFIFPISRGTDDRTYHTRTNPIAGRDPARRDPTVAGVARYAEKQGLI